ncbi:MAG: MBL fold metallo-hydrolase [Ignavibacteriaceae bacterium]|nr:MBL fold metallo-hydrolase [Ignavibacteriaceae bacterium]
MKRRSFLKTGLLTGAAAIAGGTGLLKAETVSDGMPAYKPVPDEWNDTEISVAWIGHSTVYINFYGYKIITDPVLYAKVGIYMLGYIYGPSRLTAPALTIDEMPRPDLILLSHAHMDHTDYKTLKEFTRRYPGQIDAITAFNTADVTSALQWKSLREMDWGEEIRTDALRIMALEVRHFGWRYPWERDRSRGFMDNGRSYNAYILERNGRKILFGGDTAMTDLFKKSGEKADIAIMPIGAYNPWLRNHCTPEEALEMANHVEAKVFIPIHCNTLKQGMEPFHEPLTRLRNAHQTYNISLGLDNVGQTFIDRA